MPFGRGVFDDKSTISAIQGFKFKNNYEIRNLREILHNICANVKMLHGHFKKKLLLHRKLEATMIIGKKI